jgi:hypothetical protein
MIRGAGPKGILETRWGSFDGFLQCLAVEKGVHLIHEKVTDFSLGEALPSVRTKGSDFKEYQLVVFATGVNSGFDKILTNGKADYRHPTTTRTIIREYLIGEEIIEKYLGNSMHVFLLDLPRLEFAALIPKADYVTLCMLGEDIDKGLVEEFLQRREVIECMPPEWRWDGHACLCSPKMNIRASQKTFQDRVVFIGDCGVARLYKDGIGSAYRTSKAAASTVVFHGVSTEDFEHNFWPACSSINRDNRLGGLVFSMTGLLQKWRFTRRAILKMVRSEQRVGGAGRLMSQVLWDTFTGSAPYREIFLKTLRPLFLGRFFRHLAASIGRS